jgi:hypothetical protein
MMPGALNIGGDIFADFDHQRFGGRHLTRLPIPRVSDNDVRSCVYVNCVDIVFNRVRDSNQLAGVAIMYRDVVGSFVKVGLHVDSS